VSPLRLEARAVPLLTFENRVEFGHPIDILVKIALGTAASLGAAFSHSRWRSHERAAARDILW
jgi:hypothetical protein